VPGAGAAKALYNGLSWFLDNYQKLGGLLDAFAASIPDLKARNSDAVAAHLLAAFKLAIPVGLGFAASQLGLSKLPQDIKAALAFVPAKIDAAIRAAVGRIALKATTVTNAAGNGGLPEGGMTKSEPFQIGDRWFVLMVVQDKAGVRVDLFEKTGAAT